MSEEQAQPAQTASSLSKTLSSAIKSIRQQLAIIDADLEKALQHRETIAARPITKSEVLENLCYAIDTSAAKFEKLLDSIISGCSRRRDGYGVNRFPEVIREIGAYHQLNIDAINFFMGDEIKTKVGRFLAEMDYPGGQDGLSNDDYKKQLEEADANVDRIKSQRDELIQELESIGAVRF